jgi:hypothetical protein
MRNKLFRVIVLVAVTPLLLAISSVDTRTIKEYTSVEQSTSGEAKLQLAKGQHNLPEQNGRERPTCS